MVFEQWNDEDQNDSYLGGCFGKREPELGHGSSIWADRLRILDVSQLFVGGLLAQRNRPPNETDIPSSVESGFPRSS